MHFITIHTSVFGMFIILNTGTAGCTINNTYSKYPWINKDFPDLFAVEDYFNKCAKSNNTPYCTASLKLIPNNISSKSWKEIESWSKSRFHYNRTVVHRTLCVHEHSVDENSIKRFNEDKTNQKLKMYNFSSKLYYVHCKETHQINIRWFFLVSALYLTLIFIATMYDETFKGQEVSWKMRKWLSYFSITSNWKKISRYGKSGSEKIKCIQGIRTFQSCIIVGGHVVLVMLQKPLKNTEELEQVFKSLFQYPFACFLLVMQTYFLISSWLLADKILKLHKKNGIFSVEDATLIFIHRIARFWPSLIVMIFFVTPLFHRFGSGPGSFEFVDHFSSGCYKNWWATMLFVSNFLETHETCNIVMWYLSIDTQLYLCAIIILYIALKYKWDIRKCLAVVFILTYVINGILIYQKDLGTDSWVNIKITSHLNYFYDKKLPFIYNGFWINSSTSIIGILFGYLYFHNEGNKNTAVLFQKYYKMIFITLPVLTVITACQDYSPLVMAFIGPLFKPMFGFGIAVGIFGMYKQVIRGYIKSICEHRYAVLLGEFSLSVYIFHPFVVFDRGINVASVIEFKLVDLVLAHIQNILVSFILGIIVTVIIEQPGNSIRSKILPLPGKRAQFQSKTK